MLNNLKENLNKIEKEIDILIKKYYKIQETRKSNGLSLAIYKCNDDMALELIEIDKQIKEKEEKLEVLKEKIKNIDFESFSKNCVLEHNKFKDNRYLISIEKNKKTIYVNKKEEVDKYIEDCKENQKNVKVLEYIDYNKTIKKECNMPMLITIFELNFNNDTKLVQIPHQGNYKPYLKEIKKISDNKIVEKIEIGYNSTNQEIFSHVINCVGDERICFHTPFSAKDYITIEKFNGTKFFVKNDSYTNYKTIEVDVLETKYQDLVDKIIKNLENCKEYKYDIEHIKNF